LAAGSGFASGITEELSRESLVVIAFSAIPVERLSNSAHLAIGIELPHSREFRPRLLECAVSVSGVRLVDSGLRISAKVNRMTIKDVTLDHKAPGDFDPGKSGIQPIAVAAGSRNIQPMVHLNHLTQKTQGEHSMSFLKKLFIEEDGQDMVEYGLVIALVVIAAAAALTAFKGNISAGLSTLGASVSASL
jgi:pilus assembly protein Flp/PilA